MLNVVCLALLALSLAAALGCRAGLPPRVHFDSTAYYLAEPPTASKELGLSMYGSLPDTKAFVMFYDDERPREVWMRGMAFPIDVVFVNADCVIARVLTDLPVPQAGTGALDDANLLRYRSKHPARYVVELNAGHARDRGIAPGQKVGFTGIDGEYGCAR